MKTNKEREETDVRTDAQTDAIVQTDAPLEETDFAGCKLADCAAFSVVALPSPSPRERDAFVAF